MRDRKFSTKVLSEQDKLIWNKYVQTVIPLKNDNKQVEKAVSSEPAFQEMSLPSIKVPVVHSTIPSSVKPRLISLRSRVIKRLNLQAVLDLHGFTEDQAYYRVIDFIKRSQIAGLREVLIITGKGHFSKYSCHSASSKNLGVLKKALPRWIGEAPLNKIVLEYAISPQKHGGEGALYIFLRK